MNDVIMKEYLKAVEEFDKKAFCDEEFAQEYKRYRELSLKLWGYIPENLKKECLELDSLDGYVLAYSGRHYFFEGWKKCLELMGKM